MRQARDRDTAPDAEPGQPAGEPVATRAGSPSITLADLPVAGMTRRRVAFLLGALVTAWVILLFARQVGQASEASARADAMRASNAALGVSVAALQSELALIGRPEFIEQQARAYRLGAPREIPFTIEDGAPALPPDAPGSTGVRLGATAERPSPLQQWLRLLFGQRGDPAGPAGGPGA